MKRQWISVMAMVATTLGVNGQLLVATTQPNGPSTVRSYTTSGVLLNASLFSGTWIEGIASDRSGNLYVAFHDSRQVQKYTTSGMRVDSFNSYDSNYPSGVALDGNGSLYVLSDLNGIVGKYTTSGTTLNTSLITGIPWGGFPCIACDGTYLYVGNSYDRNIAQYALSGSLVNPDRISLPWGLGPVALACDGDGHLFASGDDGKVGVFGTDGSIINASLISGLNRPFGLALDGAGHLFVSSWIGNTDGTVGEYTTGGQVINASLITGVGEPGPLVVVIPEPTNASLVLVGSACVVGFIASRRNQASFLAARRPALAPLSALSPSGQPIHQSLVTCRLLLRGCGHFVRRGGECPTWQMHWTARFRPVCISKRHWPAASDLHR